MQTYIGTNAILIRAGQHVALAQRFGQEFCISCYRQGYKAMADDGHISGGRLPKSALSGSLVLFQELLRTVQAQWHGQEFYFDAPDERRLRIYKRMLKRYGIRHTVYGDVVTFIL